MSGSEAYTFYEEGMRYFKRENFRQAHLYFCRAYASNPANELLPAIQSYLGFTLAIVEGKEREGFKLLHDALQQDFCRADFFINLGQAHLRKNQRKQALNAFYNGLKNCPNDPHISRVLLEVGKRRKPALGFLRREHPLNVWLGRRSYERLRKRERLTQRGRRAFKPLQPPTGI